MASYNDGLYTPWEASTTESPTTIPIVTSAASSIQVTTIPTTPLLAATTTTTATTTTKQEFSSTISLWTHNPLSNPTISSWIETPYSSSSTLPTTSSSSTPLPASTSHSSFKIAYLTPVFIIIPILLILTGLGWSYKRCWGRDGGGGGGYYDGFDNDEYEKRGGGGVLTKEEEERLVKGWKVPSSSVGSIPPRWNLANIISASTASLVSLLHPRASTHDMNERVDFRAVPYTSLEKPFLSPSASKSNFLKWKYTIPADEEETEPGYKWGQNQTRSPPNPPSETWWQSSSRSRGRIRPKKAYAPSFSSNSSNSLIASLSRRLSSHQQSHPYPQAGDDLPPSPPSPYHTLAGQALEERSLALDSLLSASRVGGGNLLANRMIDQPSSPRSPRPKLPPLPTAPGKMHLSPTKKTSKVVREWEAEREEEEIGKGSEYCERKVWEVPARSSTPIVFLSGGGGHQREAAETTFLISPVREDRKPAREERQPLRERDDLRDIFRFEEPKPLEPLAPSRVKHVVSKLEGLSSATVNPFIAPTANAKRYQRPISLSASTNSESCYSPSPSPTTTTNQTSSYPSTANSSCTHLPIPPALNKRSRSTIEYNPLSSSTTSSSESGCDCGAEGEGVRGLILNRSKTSVERDREVDVRGKGVVVEMRKESALERRLRLGRGGGGF